MSRVFEALTAAVYEKRNPAKPELGCTASEGYLTARFYPVLRTESALTEAHSSLDSPTTGEEMPQTCESENDSDRPEFSLHEHKRDSEDRRQFHFKRAWVAALLATVALVLVYLGMPGDYAIPIPANRFDFSAPAT